MSLPFRDIVTHLKRVPLFDGLRDSELERLAEHCRLRTFKAREAIFHEGDDGHTLYIVLSGSVRVQRVSEQGDTIHIADRGPGEHLGEMSLLDGKRRSADVVTNAACQVLLLSREPFLEWVGSSPSIALSLLASLAGRLREAADQRITLPLPVMGRLCACLRKLAARHGVPDPQGGTRINLKLTQQDIADRVGADRATVNRALGELKECNAVVLREGCYVITDDRRLKKLEEG